MEQTKIEALANYLEVEANEITEGYYSEGFSCDGAEYLVLTEEEANDRVKEEIKNSLWAFRAEFIIEHCKNYEEMTTDEYNSAVESLRAAQEKCCESANGLVMALIDDIDEFIDDAIDADGRGHFLAQYDGYEIEQDDLYIYRVD